MCISTPLGAGKAYMSIYGDSSGIRRDAWFWWEQVHKGSVVAVRPTVGWGPHSGREDVLYIGTEVSHQSGVYGAVDATTLTRANRHIYRQQVNQANSTTSPYPGVSEGGIRLRQFWSAHHVARHEQPHTDNASLRHRPLFSCASGYRRCQTDQRTCVTQWAACR